MADLPDNHPGRLRKRPVVTEELRQKALSSVLDMDLFIQLKNMGLVTWTEYQTMDRDLALAMLEAQNALISKVEAQQAEVRKKQEAELERQKRLAELDRLAQQYSR